MNAIRTTVLVAVLVTPLVIAGEVDMASAQQPNIRTKTYSGPYDSEISYPIVEGRIGQKDPAAMAEITATVASISLPEQSALELKGFVAHGSRDSDQRRPASLVIESGSRFRMDIQESYGVGSVRISGGIGQMKRLNGATEPLVDIEYGDPLALPSQLLNIVDRADAAVIYDGRLVGGGRTMDKVTVTLFRPRVGGPLAASFYFDPETHLLEKSVFVDRGAINHSLEVLRVVSYGDYRKEQSITVPHEYLETVNGHKLMTFTVTETDVTVRHDDTYFVF
jgi:hypothetical protein